MKIIVSGGAGFIGSHLCEALLGLGHEVVSVDNLNGFYDPDVKRGNLREISAHPRGAHFRSVEADIRDRDGMASLFASAKPDLVVHLAAMAGVRPSIEDPLLYEDVNVRGTSVLLDLCRQNGVVHFVFASSSSVYGNNPKVPFSESDSVDHPISPYAATKKAGELLCHVYAHLYGFRVACLRFFTVYGPRQRPDLAIHKFTELISQGREVPFFGDGSTQRDYTYIDDIIDGVLKAIDWTRKAPEKTHEIFNLGESRTISLSELVTGLEKAVGRSAKLKRLPMQPGDVLRTYADVAKAVRILGYRPAMDLETGLTRFVDWYRRRHAAGPGSPES